MRSELRSPGSTVGQNGIPSHCQTNVQASGRAVALYIMRNSPIRRSGRQVRPTTHKEHMVEHHFQSLPHVLAQEVSDVVPSRSTWYYKIGGVYYVNVGVRNRIRGRLSTESSDQRQTEAETGSDDKVPV